MQRFEVWSGGRSHSSAEFKYTVAYMTMEPSMIKLLMFGLDIFIALQGKYYRCIGEVNGSSVSCVVSSAVNQHEG